MEHWARLCGLAEAPAEGAVSEAEVEGVSVCLARIGGTLHALGNLCPHRQGPLGQGWIEGKAVVCPWHSWAFDLTTGAALPPERGQVETYELRIDEAAVLVRLP